MNDVKPLRTHEEIPATRDGAVSPDKKKKNLDELIEQFNRDNPAKNPQKTYRGVY